MVRRSNSVRNKTKRNGSETKQRDFARFASIAKRLILQMKRNVNKAKQVKRNENEAKQAKQNKNELCGGGKKCSRNPPEKATEVSVGFP